MSKNVVPLEKRRVAIRPFEWTPARVNRKLQAVIPRVNEQLPPLVFLELTAERADDVPVVRVLAGPRDPYSAERIGSLAFYSTHRGMEWYTKSTGMNRSVVNRNTVYVTYFEDSTQAEQPALELSLSDGDAAWAAKILELFEA
jgi:hypothetical protein